MPWKELCTLKLQDGNYSLLYSEVIECAKAFDERYRKALELLKQYSEMSVKQLKEQIRKRGGKPYSGFNKFGLMLQLLGLEFDRQFLLVFEHYIQLKRR